MKNALTSGAKQEKTASAWEQRTFNTISNSTNVIHICHSTQLSCSAGGARICETKWFSPTSATEFSYRPTFYFNAGTSASTSSATRFAAGPSSGQTAVSPAASADVPTPLPLPGPRASGSSHSVRAQRGWISCKKTQRLHKFTVHSLIFFKLFV